MIDSHSLRGASSQCPTPAHYLSHRAISLPTGATNGRSISPRAAILPRAADVLAQTVELAPGFATAWFALGAIRDRLGDRSGAIAAFAQARDADPEDYHGARLQLARLGAGDAAPAMTETYVRRLFDQYAGRYDAALTEHLHYRGPAMLRDAVEAAEGDGRTAAAL